MLLSFVILRFLWRLNLFKGFFEYFLFLFLKPLCDPRLLLKRLIHLFRSFVHLIQPSLQQIRIILQQPLIPFCQSRDLEVEGHDLIRQSLHIFLAAFPT